MSTETLIPSEYQADIYDFVQHGEGNAVVIAVAGSGKTTTILEALRLIPSSQSVQLFAFNTAIAQELKNRLPPGARHIRASTFHSVGYQALCQSFGLKQIETNGRKLQQLCRKQIPSFTERLRYESYVCRLVDLAKGAGVGCLIEDEWAVWEEIIAHHDLYLDDPHAKETTAIEIARELLEASTEAAKNEYLIDFSDQLYLTILWQLPLEQKDWVFVDEAQDTNAIRRAIVRQTLKPGGRLMAVGDPKQSIYGFTGASVDAIDLIREEWDCRELPLSVSYRCPQAVIEQAQTIVPYIKAAPGADRGLVAWRTRREALLELGPTDVVLCRNNAPLVDLAYQCLSKGIGCQILGRDIGKGLQILVEKMKAADLDDLEQKLGEYRRREMKKLIETDQHAKAQSVDDRVQCLLTLADNLPETGRTLQDLATALDRLFGDEIVGRLTLSTVHKAKGKEWPTVAILKPDLMPAHWAKDGWQLEQEEHLQYVAWTRARQTLLFLED